MVQTGITSVDAVGFAEVGILSMHTMTSPARDGCPGFKHVRKVACLGSLPGSRYLAIIFPEMSYAVR